MSGHTPHSLSLHGAVPMEATNVWPGLAKGRGHGDSASVFWVISTEPTLGQSGPLALSAALRLLGQRGLRHPPTSSVLPSAKVLCPLGHCCVETALARTSTPSMSQLRPRPRGKALAERSLGRPPGMSGHIPRSLPLQGAVPLEARKFWARLQKGRDHAGFCLWSVGLPSRADLVA